MLYCSRSPGDGSGIGDKNMKKIVSVLLATAIMTAFAASSTGCMLSKPDVDGEYVAELDLTPIMKSAFETSLGDQGIDIDEVSKEVGIGAVIFQELSNNRIKDYTFSWDKVTNFDGETGPYVQYTHARASSVLRNAAPEELEAIRNGSADWSYLESDSAYALIKLLYRVPEIVLEAADKYEPSIVTRHLVDIAQAFNKFYHDEHILVDNKDEKLAKLSLVLAAKTVIANCLGLLGIKAPERM